MSTIITRNSATSGSTPSSLVQGELAINVTDGRLFYGSGSGNVVKEFTVSGSGGATNTGSLLTTASFSNPNLTFTKGDSSTFNVNISSLTVTSASYALTASYVNPLKQDVIISGSLNVTSSFTASGLNYPAVDNGEESFMQTDGNGNLSLQYVKTIYEEIVNGETTQLVKGTPVYVSGSQGAASIVYRADPLIPLKMPAIYIAADTLSAGEAGRGIALGLIKGVDTTGYPAGTEIYLAPGGGFTATRPTGSAIVQVLGYVTKEGSGGQGVILNPGPVTLPNLPSGSVWVGNSDSVPVATLTSSLSVLSAVSASYVSGSVVAPGSTTQVVFNNGGVLGANSGFVYSGSNVGIGTSTPLRTLDVNGISRFRQFIGLDSSTESNRTIFFTNGDNLGTYASGLIRASVLQFFNSNTEVARMTNNSLTIGATTAGARLDVRAQGALSTDIAFRVRNSADTSNLIETRGNGYHNIGDGTYGIIINNTTANHRVDGNISLVNILDLRNNITHTNGVSDISFRTTQAPLTNGYALNPYYERFVFGATTTSGFGTGNPSRFIGIYNGTAPNGTAADSFALYSADRNGVAGKASPHFRTEDGTVIWLGDESRLFNVTASRTIISSSQNTVSGSSLTVYGSGSAQPVFTVQGSQGELFSITDSLSGSLFSVNDISGLPILEVFSDNTTLIGDYQDPMLITTKKVTMTNSGSFVVYSLPTASYDTAFYDYSIRSGSNARAGQIMAIQEGSSVIFTETTTTDFGDTTPVSFTVIVSGSNMVLTGSAVTGSWTTKCIIRGL
jgi:hypothetical protein